MAYATITDTAHAERRMRERGITVAQVAEAIAQPVGPWLRVVSVERLGAVGIGAQVITVHRVSGRRL